MFVSDGDARLDRFSLGMSVDRRIGARWTLGFGFAGTMAGEFVAHGTSYSLASGPSADVHASYRPLDEGARRPFVLITISAAAAVTATRGPAGAAPTLSAFDLRGGVVTGKTFARMVTLYAVFRAFGGPVFYSFDNGVALGGDRYHVQLGGGLVIRAGRFDLALEGVPLGEQQATASAGFAFP